MAMAARTTDLPRMSIDEFLAWDSGDDLRYELVGGWPVAQSAPSKSHGQVGISLGSAIKNRLRAADRPCMPESGSVLRIDKRWTVRAPDILVRCGSSRRSADTPILAVEVLSPSNSAGEMARKRDDYASAGIVQVLEVEQASAEAWLYRREGDRWVLETIRGLDAMIELESIGISIPMAEIYEDVELIPERDGRPPVP
ncbi:Uma2 family endonuclease [Niveispirillum sp. KHB5.9]|uniref:Uma2 family endonuclease n=1 Tax=Niveispirillum sp. KHB5.9 TaxID=3400269 RepID=UPI003A861A85